jgi:hypothetical protein
MKTKIQARKKLQANKIALKVLLFCGIFSSLLYVSMDVIAGMIYYGYSFNSQAISELSAIGAPTRLFWIVMSFFFNPLVIAFGVGVWLYAGRKRSLQIAGILLALWGALGFVWLFFPMHMRGAIGGSATDTGHLVLSAVTVLLMTMFISFGSGASGKLFRIYSILTILVMLSFGAYVGTQAPRVAAQLPTPWMGVMERVSVFSPMLWVLVLAVVLLRVEKGAKNN